MFCPRCSAYNRADARFCHACGASLVPATVAGEAAAAGSPATALQPAAAPPAESDEAASPLIDPDAVPASAAGPEPDLADGALVGEGTAVAAPSGVLLTSGVGVGLVADWKSATV